MNGNSKRYPTNDRELASAITGTVAAVRGKDPLEMDPLYDTVDPDVLDTAIGGMDQGQVSFTYDGVDVTVTSSEEIVVEGTENGVHLNETIDSASNVLLRSASDNGHDDDACITSVSQRSADETNLLGVTYSQDAYKRLNLWENDDGKYPANTTVVDVGAQTRSAASDSTGTIDFPPDPFTIRTIANETNLAGLGQLVSKELSQWEHNENHTIVCFYSVTDLLEHVDEEMAFKFLHVLTSRFESEQVTAHYHINPEAHDDKTIQMFSELFDAVVDVHENGVWSVDTNSSAQ